MFIHNNEIMDSHIYIHSDRYNKHKKKITICKIVMSPRVICIYYHLMLFKFYVYMGYIFMMAENS